jgi:hypothetical protein
LARMERMRRVSSMSTCVWEQGGVSDNPEDLRGDECGTPSRRVLGCCEELQAVKPCRQIAAINA